MRLPLWARVLDVLGVALLLLGASIAVTGGFRESTPIGRLSITSWWRPFVIGLFLLLVRYRIHRQIPVWQRVRHAVQQWRATPDAAALLPIFVGSRIGVLLAGFFGIALIGYAPNMPPYRVYENDFLNMPARWDTGWYLTIAVEGYSFSHAHANEQQNIAFFPVLPMIMRYGALFAARQVLWVGVGVALVSFFLALPYLFRLARESLTEDQAIAGIAFLAAYPFALFYSAAYTESLFLLCAVGAWYHFERDELWKAGTWGLIAGLTRPNGCLLSIVLAVIAMRPSWRRAMVNGVASLRLVPIIRRLAFAALPGIGMLIYSAFIYRLTGNPFQWAAQNAAWGRVYKGLGVLVDDQVSFVQHYGFYEYASTQTLNLLHALALIFILASVWPVYRRFGLPYAVFVLVNILPPLALGGLLSMGRLTSVIFPSFLWLGAAIPPRQRTGWLIGFAMLQAVCAVAFFTWRPLY